MSEKIDINHLNECAAAQSVDSLTCLEKFQRDNERFYDSCFESFDCLFTCAYDLLFSPGSICFFSALLCLATFLAAICSMINPAATLTSTILDFILFVIIVLIYTYRRSLFGVLLIGIPLFLAFLTALLLWLYYETSNPFVCLVNALFLVIALCLQGQCNDILLAKE
jgi:hypothetical protein